MSRTTTIKTLYFVLIALIIMRLFYWQVVKSEDLAVKAQNQRTRTLTALGKRGTIFFKDGSILASTRPSFLLFLQPNVIKTKKEIDAKKYSRDLAERLIMLEAKKAAEKNEQEEEKSKIYDDIKRLSDTILRNIGQDLYWVGLGRTADINEKKELEELKLTGLGFERTNKRFYPEGSSSAHLLGFVGSDTYGDETGYFGLEGFYNGELKGKRGTQIEEKDALGMPIIIGKFFSKEPKRGKSLRLNIDRTVQHIIAQKLLAGVEKYGAKGGSAIAMEPKTGAILGMVSYPGYDPENPQKYPKENYKNPAVADGYEPGSVFKVIVMAAAINEGLIEPDTKCDICSGPVNISGYSIRTWNNKYRPNLTMAETIIHSDNTGMVFVGKKLGIEKFYSYIEKFGFGLPTGVDLQDERSQEIRPKAQWREIDLATASFGQGVSVTALQMLKAVAAIANGGNLMEPQIVSEIIDGQSAQKINPKVLGTPINTESAKKITEMMVKAVDEGEAKWAKPKGYKIAGKTGTAQIPVAGHYDPNKTIASFVGFAPADNPRFVMLVRYEQPSSSPYGSETAAPTFFEIAKELFFYYGITPADP